MSQGIASYLSANRAVTNLGGGFRHLRLPQMSPFPKLNRAALPANKNGAARPQARAHTSGMIIAGGTDVVPEMATDMVNATRGCAVENVKRSPAASAGRRSWAQLLGWRR